MPAVDDFVFESLTGEDGDVGTGEHEEGEEFGQSVRASPGMKGGPLVGAEEPAQFGGGLLERSEVGGGLPRVGRA